MYWLALGTATATALAAGVLIGRWWRARTDDAEKYRMALNIVDALRIECSRLEEIVEAHVRTRIVNWPPRSDAEADAMTITRIEEYLRGATHD
jgi:hypothetical protein